MRVCGQRGGVRGVQGEGLWTEGCGEEGTGHVTG